MVREPDWLEYLVWWHRYVDAATENSPGVSIVVAPRDLVFPEGRDLAVAVVGRGGGGEEEGGRGEGETDKLWAACGHVWSGC
jgi:hypothetical protein